MHIFHKIPRGLANSVDPDQTAPSGALRSGSTQFTYVHVNTIFILQYQFQEHWDLGLHSLHMYMSILFLSYNINLRSIEIWVYTVYICTCQYYFYLTISISGALRSGSTQFTYVHVNIIFILQYQFQEHWDLGLHSLHMYMSILFLSYNINLDSFHLQSPLLNPSLAEHDMPCLSKQCRSRSVGFWRSQLIWICTDCH